MWKSIAHGRGRPRDLTHVRDLIAVKPNRAKYAPRWDGPKNSAAEVEWPPDRETRNSARCWSLRRW